MTQNNKVDTAVIPENAVLKSKVEELEKVLAENAVLKSKVEELEKARKTKSTLTLKHKEMLENLGVDLEKVPAKKDPKKVLVVLLSRVQITEEKEGEAGEFVEVDEKLAQKLIENELAGEL